MEAYASHSLKDEGSSTDSEFEESAAASDSATFAKPPSLMTIIKTPVPTSKKPPTPVRQSAKDMSAHDIQTQLVMLGRKPSGFYHDDMETLQERYDDDYAKALKNSNDWIDAQKNARLEQVKEVQNTRAAWREKIEEEDALERNPQIVAFMKQLKSGKGQKHIVFNNVGPVICRYIVRNLPPDSGVTSLELCRNRINDKIATSIAEMLKHNKTLKKLELESNRIGALGCEELAKAVAGNDQLQYLGLMSNPISSNSSTMKRDKCGIDALSDMLQYNKSLRTLNIRSTQIDTRGGTSIVRGLLTNDTLLILEMDTTDLKFQGLYDLGAKITENKQRWTVAKRQAKQARLAQMKKSAAEAEKKAAEDKVIEEAAWENDQRRVRIRTRQKILEAQVQDRLLQAERQKRYDERRRLEEQAKKEHEEKQKKKAEKRRNRHGGLPHRGARGLKPR